MASSEDSYPADATLRAAADLHAAEMHDRLAAAAALVEAEASAPELRVLTAAHELVGMDVSYFTRFRTFDQVVQRVHGDADSFGLRAGTTIRLVDTFCQRVTEGRLPNLIPDARRDERAAGLVPAFGSYLGIPMYFDDGSLYGTLCCASRDPAPGLLGHHLAFMRVLGQILAGDLERREVAGEAQRHRNETIALSALFAGLDARDQNTGRHSQVVVGLAVMVARELALPEAFVEEVRQVALLHDIGKLGIPDAILAKPGPLDEADWEVMHTHPIIGAQIVESIDALLHLAPAIRAEHERYDGEGYPDGLTREQIPLASRITFACDAYDAMISSRPYRGKMPVPAAVSELRDKAGTQFDPKVVAALLRLVVRQPS